MGLVVWLPLTKDLRQQGLNNNYSVSTSTATYSSTEGKLGGCYNFSGTTGNGILLSGDVTTFMNTYINNHSWSMCAWVKNSVSDRSTPVISLTYGLRMTAGATTGVSLYNSSRTVSCTSSVATGDGKWHHIVATYNVNTNAIKIYVDGINTGNATYTSGYTYASSWTNGLFIGRDPNNSTANASYFYQGAMNDVRIYDHCLSPMEVKELAKGLVLHYPLNRQGWGQDNILLNTGFQARYTQSTGWDTTKNGTQLANSWGGYNSGVGNQATVYHAHLKEFNGEWVYEYIKTANESWLGISQGGLQSKLTAGKKYTFSWEQYSVSGSNYNHGGLYYYKTGASSANFHLGSFSGTGGITGQWKKFSYTFTAPSDADYSKNMSWYIYGMNGGNGTLYMRHPKLEEGESATPWIPNLSDTLATTMGLNSTTEYDCSGFCNNGTRIGTFTWTSDTPKYSVSQVFNGTDNAIQTPNLTTMITDKNYTIACWTYKTVIGTKNYQTIYGGPSGFELEARSGSSTSPLYRIYNWGGGTTAYNFEEWTHFCFVHTDSDSKLYVNGVLKITGTSANVPSGNYFVGAWSNSNSQNYEGLMSDFRIYATALSASDVKSLYQNCATIDPDGTIRGQIRS